MIFLTAICLVLLLGTTFHGPEFFLSQPVFAGMTGGEITDPEVLAKQKALLRKLQRAILIG